MRTRKTRTAAAITVIGLAATGCGGTAGGGGGGGTGDTVTISIPSDPGTLSPMNTSVSIAVAMNKYAYDPLVNIAPDGKVISGLAEKWSATPKSAEFVLRDGVTCQDGSKLTASDVAAMFNHVADPKNAAALIGLAVPPMAKAEADDATRTITLSLENPAPFLLQMAALMPIPCKKGMGDPKALARTTDGTGPYRLERAVPGDQYTYVRRDGYAWGPGGATGAELPAKVVFKVVANESTAANLLLAGQLDVAEVNGPDRQRLDAAKIASQAPMLPLGELLFNEGKGHPTADFAVRHALVGAVDLKQIGSVATGGLGKPATNLGEVAPTPCTGDTVTGNVPPHDPAKAAASLTEAGWTKTGGVWTKDGKPLTITVPFPGTKGPRVTSAMELMARQWTDFGAKVTTKPMQHSTLDAILASDAWDIIWLPIAVQLPDQLIPFFDGAAPPKGQNFGHVDNPDYRRLTAKAAAKPGQEGCPDWEAANAALVKRLDVLTFVTAPKPIYYKGVEFRLEGDSVIPTSLRKTAR
ncbi:ABC transporter substrate-binding protein [Spongiactinospora sp. 9N601]|uniref:ABC transporter substrate-binding protein n=1 Tax=Spongiactinospora sp. 9N601 TaxID=3375149 RepID=UPI0037A79F7C